MPKALIIQNEEIVPPGIVLEALQDLKWQAEVVLMEERQSIPSPYEYDSLVLLGGTMNVDDVSRFPHLDSLRRVTAEAVKRDFPIIGLCLGAQMLSRAAGAEVRRNSCGETGWCEIMLNEKGFRDPMLDGVKNPFEVFQFHEDSFDLPGNAELLGSSVRCPSQIMKLGKNVYGFQCHIEVSKDIITDWVNGYYSEVEEKLGQGGPERVLRQTAEKIAVYNEVCRQIFINYFRGIE